MRSERAVSSAPNGPPQRSRPPDRPSWSWRRAPDVTYSIERLIFWAHSNQHCCWRTANAAAATRGRGLRGSVLGSVWQRDLAAAHGQVDRAIESMRQAHSRVAVRGALGTSQAKLVLLASWHRTAARRQARETTADTRGHWRTAVQCGDPLTSPQRSLISHTSPDSKRSAESVPQGFDPPDVAQAAAQRSPRPKQCWNKHQVANHGAGRQLMGWLEPVFQR
jgi:hypothetical protein